MMITMPKDMQLSPELSFEISESQQSLEDIIAYVESSFPGWKFNRTEPRYLSCIMAIFEYKGV